MLISLGFVVGFTLGIVLHRGDFCMHAALREVVEGRRGWNVHAYLLALAIQVVVVNALGGLGWLSVPAPPVAAVAAAIGGLIFGIGMVLAKG